MDAAKQFSFRLPQALIRRVDECTSQLQAVGLELSRADVVRLLLKHALDATQCKVDRLLGGENPRGRARTRS